jgi:hypothetical protein
MKSAHTFEYDSGNLNVHSFVAKRGDFMCAIIPRLLRSCGPLLCVVVFAGLSASAQGLTSEAPDLGLKIAALTHSIEQMQSELQQSRLEIQQLRDMKRIRRPRLLLMSMPPSARSRKILRRMHPSRASRKTIGRSSMPESKSTSK